MNFIARPKLRVPSLSVRKGALRHLLELVVVLSAYFIYEILGKFGTPNIEVVAYENALRVISWETSLGISWEQAWQEWAITNWHAVVVFLNYVYTLGYWPVILPIAVTVYVKDRPRYVYYRNIVLVSFALALIVFSTLPLAPPRILPAEFGFIDTIKQFGPTIYSSRDVAAYYNLFMAMPSMHIGWTILISVLILRSKTFFALKAFVAIYPILTFFAIILTANHYIIDAVGGVGVLLVAYLLYEGLLRWKRRFLRPVVAA